MDIAVPKEFVIHATKPEIELASRAISYYLAEMRDGIPGMEQFALMNFRDQMERRLWDSRTTEVVKEDPNA